MRGAGSPLEDVTDSFAVFSIDGPQAWAVLRDLFGRDILGLPYLSIDDQDLDATKVRLMRAGKTSEFGYLLAVPAEEAAKVWGRVREAGASQCAGLCGLDVFDLLKLDGRFFNVNREGRRVRDPLPLGLQWMIDFQKERFCGRDAILARREAGVPSKILGVGLRDGARGMSAGDGVELDGDRVGEVVTCGFSGTLRREIGLALVDVSVAYSGLDIVVRGAEGALPARSISMPPFVPRSLLVKLGDV
jgi:aminomethyltransferase